MTSPATTLQFTRAPIIGTPTGGMLRNRMILKGAVLAGSALSVSLSAQPATTLPDGERVQSLRPDDPLEFLRTDRVFRPTRMRLSASDRRAALAVATATRAEVAILENVEMLDLALPLRKAGLRVVLDMHNIEASLLAQTFRARTQWDPAALLRHRLKVLFATRVDRRVWRMVDEIWLCSAEDAAALAPATNCVVIGNPVPESAAFDLPIVAERYARCTAIFCGLLSYPPNRQAIETLLNEIAPQLVSAGLAPQITIAGRNPKQLFLDQHRPPLSAIISDPESMLPYLAEAGYSLLPITFGGGTRLKVLEAFAAGAVVIATPMSVKGCGAIAGQHYVAAETPQSIADALYKFLKTPALAVEMAERARDHARLHFHEDHLATLVRDRIEAIRTHPAAASDQAPSTVS